MRDNNRNREQSVIYPTDKFDTVKFFRGVKKKIAIETKGMSFEEFKSYMASRKLKTVGK